MNHNGHWIKDLSLLDQMSNTTTHFLLQVSLKIWQDVLESSFYDVHHLPFSKYKDSQWLNKPINNIPIQVAPGPALTKLPLCWVTTIPSDMSRPASLPSRDKGDLQLVFPEITGRGRVFLPFLGEYSPLSMTTVEASANSMQTSGDVYSLWPHYP